MGSEINAILNHPLVGLIRNLTVLFLAVMYFAVIFWTWRDANRRGARGWFWGLVCVVFPFVGWLVYLVVRPPETLEDAH
jgi:uncharacterized membrane protein YhaH (DUF805 family)